MPTETETADALGLAVGTEIGSLAPDFSTELLNGETFRLSEHRGQVVIINFWAVTCAPCIQELPYYEQLKTAYPDVEILAVHHKAGAKNAKAFLADKGWDHLDFALDSKEKGILPLLNASDAMPQTIILNKQGAVTYNAQAPLSYNQLEELYKAALTDKTGAPTAEKESIIPKPTAEPAAKPFALAGIGLPSNKAVYSVTVVDQNAHPVAGVMLAFCTDTACRNSDYSDENGKITMMLEPDQYHVQVVDAPEGFDGTEEPELYMGPESGEATLTVTRK